jgi:hypothetical protein
MMAVFLLFFEQKDPLSLKFKSNNEEKIDE